MPEFVLDLGTREASKTFAELSSFEQGYIEAMFFTSTGPDNAEEGLEHATVAELAPETLRCIKEDCRRFQAESAGTILFRLYESDVDYSPEQAGRDFWYSRCGHGVGFFDRDLGDDGDKLQALARNAGARDLYRGDDGLLYVM